MKKMKMIEVKSELGAGTRGASLGPDALKIASLEQGSNFFGKFKRKEIRDSSLLLFKNPVRTHAKRIRGIMKYSRNWPARYTTKSSWGISPWLYRATIPAEAVLLPALKWPFPKNGSG